jgi:hypothetical protein
VTLDGLRLQASDHLADYVIIDGRMMVAPRPVVDALHDLRAGTITAERLAAQVEWRRRWYTRPQDAWWER